MMKGEYREEEKQEDEISHHHHHHQIPTNSTPQNDTSTTTFPKFQTQNHPNKFLSSPPPHFLLPPHHFQHQPLQNYQTTPPPKKLKNHPTTTTTSSEETGTIELSRRPRGRPPGSKNKPKPAIFVTRSPDPDMSPYILELQPGSDIIESLTRFTRKRGVGLSVLTATGAIRNVTLNQPSISISINNSNNDNSAVTFHGRFDILSISACLNVNPMLLNGPAVGLGLGVTILLAGPNGQIVGGKVVGQLICDGTVFVVATSFNNPNYFKLPLRELIEENVKKGNISNNNNNYTSGGNGGGESNSPISGDGDGGGRGGQMSLYMGNSSNDDIWGNTSSANVRQTQPRY